MSRMFTWALSQEAPIFVALSAMVALSLIYALGTVGAVALLLLGIVPVRVGAVAVAAWVVVAIAYARREVTQ